MKRNRQFLAGIAAIILLLGILFSFYYISSHAQHHCTDGDCAVCIGVQQASRLLNNLKIIPILSFVVAVLSVFTLERGSVSHFAKRKETLITLKVELLD
ncbi:hypothetical protein [[Clostridium] polysaccharolyticum]|uniref:Uncharacterized protein n=1 Tax=[Clostridium] polysaccharolyticum TaxID=29364 RepID=A0A1I0DFQ6_9FIRM|nr:hypothetical protein [[Clostridium] polysaccharolyticum]SET31196.1 hypothetical protein SAMN04487772_11456 [[Clostridium] polysaccharolyticum]